MLPKSNIHDIVDWKYFKVGILKLIKFLERGMKAFKLGWVKIGSEWFKDGSTLKM